MTRTTRRSGGRFCNHLIRNMVLSLIAKRHGIKVDYFSHSRIRDTLGVTLHSGARTFHGSGVALTDESAYRLLTDATATVDSNLIAKNVFFQTQVLTDLIVRELNTESQMTNVKQCNPFRQRYGRNRDLFVHVRLGDVRRMGKNLPFEYYSTLIAAAEYDNLHIASDSLKHPFITRLLSEFPEGQLCRKEPIKTLQFGSTCKHIILSHGSFSAVLGYLAFDSKTIVYHKCYNDRRKWHNEGLFQRKGWKEVDFDRLR